MKKLTILILCLFIVASIAPLSASAFDMPASAFIFDASRGEITGMTEDAKEQCKSRWYQDDDMSIVLPSTIGGVKVKSIGPKAFQESLFAGVTIPDSVTSIGEQAFYDSIFLKYINLPENIVEVGYASFNDTPCYFDSANWSDNVMYLGNWLIQTEFHRKLSGTYEIKPGTIGIANGAFLFEKLKAIVVPDSVKYIGASAFNSLGKLQSITIPDSVISIGEGAFANCKNLKRIYISKNIEKIGDDIFSDSKCLTDIYYGGTEEQWRKVAVNLNTSAKIHFDTAEWEFRKNLDKPQKSERNIIVVMVLIIAALVVIASVSAYIFVKRKHGRAIQAQ